MEKLDQELRRHELEKLALEPKASEPTTLNKVSIVDHEHLRKAKTEEPENVEDESKMETKATSIQKINKHNKTKKKRICCWVC